MIRSTRRHPFPLWIAGVALLGMTTAFTGCSPSSSPEAEPASPPSATVTASSTPSEGAVPPQHWAYSGEEGPDHWGELASAFATCGSGTAQSPVDLPSAATVETDDLVLTYAAVDEAPVDTGHTLQLNAQPGAGLRYGGVEYSLLQVHYHDPSEHTIDGVEAPIEFHFVNQDADGNLLVIGVLGVAGGENDSFGPLVDAAASGTTPVPATVDVPSMMPSSLSHFAYEGSLTTPPCTEHVQWLVMDTPVDLGQDQIDSLRDRYSENNRPVQPLNGREVHSSDR